MNQTMLCGQILADARHGSARLPAKRLAIQVDSDISIYQNRTERGCCTRTPIKIYSRSDVPDFCNSIKKEIFDEIISMVSNWFCY
ncbi:MAG: hypothetical protein OEU84_06950, partial [Xanthomonadales bacterium]|nr:hypothetical protein [Xanthomonadales bacterium]